MMHIYMRRTIRKVMGKVGPKQKKNIWYAKIKGPPVHREKNSSNSGKSHSSHYFSNGPSLRIFRRNLFALCIEVFKQKIERKIYGIWN